MLTAPTNHKVAATVEDNLGFVEKHKGKLCGSAVMALGLCLLVWVVPALVISWNYCVRLNPPRVSQAIPLIDKYLKGRRYFYDSSLPHKLSEEELDACRRRVTNTTKLNGVDFGIMDPDKALELLYHCTKVPGNWEKVPEKLKGVFWMKGNGMGEELAVLQNGQYFEDEMIYVSPFSPFMWAWSWGTPRHAPGFGYFYSKDKVKEQAYSLVSLRPTFSYKWEQCPGRPWMVWPFGVPGSRCDSDTSPSANSMTYGTLHSHVMGDLKTVSQPEFYTVEEMPKEVVPGSKYYRGIYYGTDWMGQCKVVAGGSYELTKVIDEKGEPLEPYYSQFIQYMGDSKLLLWTGSQTPFR